MNEQNNLNKTRMNDENNSNENVINSQNNIIFINDEILRCDNERQIN